jgi:hypothetical protein
MIHPRQAEPHEDDSCVSKIVIEFAIPTYIPIAAQREIDSIVQSLARMKMNTPVGHVHWCSGVGAQLHWSQADATFLGKPVDPTAPLRGEPTFDDSVLAFETTCRPLNPGEKA